MVTDTLALRLTDDRRDHARPFTMPRRFAEQFRLVAEYYECPPDEVELMKAAVRRDREAAATCYEALAAEIADIKALGPMTAEQYWEWRKGQPL